MISIIQALEELQSIQTGSTILQTGNSSENDFSDASPNNDKLDKEITNNKFTGPGKTDGKVDPNLFPPNPEVAFLYVNTPLMRITKTRI